VSRSQPYDLVALQRLLDLLDEETRSDFKRVPGFVQWFDHKPLPVFDGLTARQVVQGGRADELARYLSSIMGGFVG
jgi:hypothetical protein